MTLLRTLLWFVVAAVAMFAAVWLAARYQRRRGDGRGRGADPAQHRLVAAVPLDRRRAGRAARRLGREPPPARLSCADARTGRGGRGRRRGGAEERAQGRGAVVGAAAHLASVGAGRPAH